MMTMVPLHPTSIGGMTSIAIICITILIMPSRLQGFTPTSFLPSKHRNRHQHHQSTTLSSSPLSTTTASTTNYDLIVIGGGSAGLTAAKFAANFGKSVCIVEASRVGGDCTWTGCVPSKTLLATAKKAWIWRQMTEQYGSDGENTIDDISIRKMLKGVKKQVDDNRNRIYEEDDSPEVLQSLGIDLAQGRATFRDARTVDVTNAVGGTKTTTHQLHAKYGIVVATGATPRNPNIAGLEKKSPTSTPYWTYENVWEEFFTSIENNQQPVSQKKVIIVGGGPIGCELSQAISRLGCSVVLVSSSRLLPEGEVDASRELQHVFEKEGIKVICNSRVVSVTSSSESDGAVGNASTTIQVTLDSSQETILGDHILVATGRVPNTQNMGLGDIGVQIKSDSNGIEVDEKLQTCVKGVFAAGDCTGDRQFTHYAGYQGAIAARNILLPLKDSGVLSEVPSTTFTDPEVASFGLTEQAALAQYGDKKRDAVSIAFRSLSKIDRAVCEGTDAHGFIKIIYQSKSKQILGATIMAPAAGELISELAVAKDAKLSFDQLATVMHSYPSYSISLQQMAADVYYDKLKKNKVLYDLLKKTGL